MTPDERQAFANEAEKAMIHPEVEDAMREFAFNMRFEFDGLPRFGLMKIAQRAAMVARAQALGVDIEELRPSPAEANSEMLRRAAEAAFRGIPTEIIDPEESD